MEWFRRMVLAPALLSLSEQYFLTRIDPMLRKLLIAGAVAAVLPALPLAAQTPPAPQTPISPADDPTGTPLMTNPRPDDRATTEPTPVQPGVTGEAPSTELTRPGTPVAPGTPGMTPGAEDVPAEMTGEGAEHNERMNRDAPPAAPSQQ
jgi:hypothetical protein